MRSSIILAVPFAAVALAQSTDTAVSEVSDGQPQATASYTNGFTSYLTLTNSLGVVTGMPVPVTTQPTAAVSQTVAVTSQATPVTFISGSPGIPDVTTSPTASIPVVASSPPIISGGGASSGFSSITVGSNTTVTTASSPSTSGSGSSGTGASGSSTPTGTSGSNPSGTQGSSSSASPTSGASAIMQPMVGLSLVGAIFAAFL